jgi:hypothetical protein
LNYSLFGRSYNYEKYEENGSGCNARLLTLKSVERAGSYNGQCVREQLLTSLDCKSGVLSPVAMRVQTKLEMANTRSA